MSNLIVVGAQWGDEGKGKIVDWLSERADYVVRYQGGHNAGHTLVVGENVYKLSVIPSGIVREGTVSIIGNGVVVEPWVFLEEAEKIRSQGIDVNPDRLKISESATLILPSHRLVDQARERARGSDKIGTTGRGIGPSYEDKVGRRAIRVCDLADPDSLAQQLDVLLNHHNAILRGFGEPEVNKQELLAELLDVAKQILPYAAPTWRILHDAREAGKKILFEGAQGALLDVDHGTYPFVTSSNTIAGEACVGSGFGPTHIENVLGLIKAYTTRVGEGPFPTELNDEIGQQIGEKGHEFGTVTGRARRCGWFDAIAVRQVVQLSGITGLAMTKIDVLDGLKELKICVGYEDDSGKYDYLPASAIGQSRMTPVYETLPAWEGEVEGVRDWDQLPAEAVQYIKRIEELVGVPVTVLSTGPEREDTILIKDLF